MTDELTTQQGDYRELMKAAVDKGLEGVEVLERIVALQERAEARMAARAFHEALRGFQADCPTIKRSKTANIVSKKTGARWSYTYAPLEEIEPTIRPHLAQHGLSYSWDSSVDGEMLSCVCTISHVDGHKETASFSCPVERSDQRSIAQDHAATLSYARRQSLVQALGLTSADEDRDGAAPRDEPITPAQLSQLEDWLAESGADREKFLKWAGVESLDQMPASMFGNAVAALKKKAGRE